jgi:undecaprenyl-diphosphatase
MLDKILSLDTELLIYLNSLGSERYDGLWLIITQQLYWTLFFWCCYFLFIKIGSQANLVFLFLAIAVLITFTDQVTNLFKMDQRLRPCSNPDINT